MARTHIGGVMNLHKLQSRPPVGSAAKVQRLVDSVLASYGKPSMSLDELREVLDKQLRKRRLSSLVLKEREAEW